MLGDMQKPAQFESAVGMHVQKLAKNFGGTPVSMTWVLTSRREVCYPDTSPVGPHSSDVLQEPPQKSSPQVSS